MVSNEWIGGPYAPCWASKEWDCKIRMDVFKMYLSFVASSSSNLKLA
jgi:hypothetical protein